MNTKIYYTQGGNISRGRRPSEIFATEGVINLVFNSEGAIFVLLYTYTESVEKKNYDEEGKEMRKRREKKCNSDLAGFELGAVGCEESV